MRIERKRVDAVLDSVKKIENPSALKNLLYDWRRATDLPLCIRLEVIFLIKQQIEKFTVGV